MKLKNIRHSKVFLVIFCLTTLLLIALFAVSTIQGRTNTEDSFLRIASYVSAGLLGLLLFFSRMFSAPEQENDSPRSRKKTVFFVLRTIFLPLLFSVISILIFVARYLQENFQGVPWGQLLYHLHTPLEGTGIDSIKEPLITGIVIFAASFLITLLFVLLLHRKQKDRRFGLVWSVFALVLLAPNLVNFWIDFEIGDYLKFTSQKSTIYEDYYVDARDVDLTFPETKRNLIYIFLESMELSYASKEVGGNMPENYIPEFTDLALNNITFSGDDSKLNGPYAVNGATFTMGGLVAQTSGVPLNENIVSNSTLNSTWSSENNYLPGVYAIGDILHDQGYNQTFMIGSDGNFAGRSSYFNGHGNYKVFDYYSAVDAGYIDSDYYVWWGYEDSKLIDYAKTELTDLASKGKPFNFTMLTADSHFVNGYYCDLCRDEFSLQYSDVVACSSRQITSFLSWIREQDFYDNTIIVLCGDHCTMDSVYLEKTNTKDFDRRMYFTIVNPDPSVSYTNVYRKFTSLDIYPTTLAAMGVTIPGDRLGLGTNLFSDTSTLAEIYGMDDLNTELLKDSKFYRSQLLYSSR